MAASNGRYEWINPKDFDVLVFVGVGFKPGNLLVSLKDQIERGPNAFEASLRRIFKRHALDLMTAAAQGYSGKVLCVPPPLTSEVSGEQSEVKIGPKAIELFNNVTAKVFAESGIIYVAQPPETIRENKWTTREYSRENNSTHMNARYGNVILNAIRDRVRQTN